MTDSTVLTPDTIKAAAVDQGWHVHRRRRGYTLAYGSDRLTVAWDKRQQLRHAALHVEHPVTAVHQFNDLTDPLQTAGLLRCLARHPSTPAFVNLIAHLDDGRVLYVPGAGHRGEPLGPYALTEPVEFRYHPLNPAQLPVVSVCEQDTGRMRFVAAAHLAHDHGDGCCTHVWAAATEHWATLADIDHDNDHPMIFGLCEPLPAMQLLLYVDDIPPTWFDND